MKSSPQFWHKNGRRNSNHRRNVMMSLIAMSVIGFAGYQLLRAVRKAQKEARTSDQLRRVFDFYQDMEGFRK
jgi:hypothetical protein